MFIYRLLADLVVVFHCAYVAFVVLGLILILVGGVCGWSWVRNFRFRVIHLLSIGIVVLQAWFGIVCPLTTLENWLRIQGSQEPYPGSFIGYWAHDLLFFEADPWVFTLVYSWFGLLVLASLIAERPGGRTLGQPAP